MDFNKLLSKFQNKSVYNIIDLVFAIFKVIYGIIPIIFFIVLFTKFKIGNIIFHPDNPTVSRLFFSAVIVAIILSALGISLEGVSTILIHKKGDITPQIALLLFIDTILNCSIFIIGGLVFAGFGITFIVSQVQSNSDITWGVFLIVFLIAFISIAVGCFEILKNYIYYKENTTEDELEKYEQLHEYITTITDNISILLFGTVFTSVPFMLISMAQTTPDLGKEGFIAILIMGLIFGIVGVLIMIFAIKKIKKQLEEKKH